MACTPPTSRPVIPPAQLPARRSFRLPAARTFYRRDEIDHPNNPAPVGGPAVTRPNNSAVCRGRPFVAPVEPPEPAGQSFTVRVWNENEELDDAFDFTVTGPGGFNQTFSWDGGPANDTTYGPFSCVPGDFHISAVQTADHENGNYFLVEIKDSEGTTILNTYDSPPDTDFTVPEL